MSERFFVAQSIAAGRVELAGDEARHLAAVMRARPGDEAILFDGSGAEFAARVAAVGKRAVQLDVAVPPRPSEAVTVSVTLPG